MTSKEENGTLRYLDAGQVVHPSGTLAGVEIRTQHDETLGSLEGVLLEPARRRIRYFVVERVAWLASRLYLLPADRFATVSRRDGRIQVEANRDEMERFDPASVMRFSDEDLIDTIFAPSAA